LQTGLYIASFSARNQLPAVRTDGGATKLEAAAEPDADTAWFFENLGNDRYRVSHRFSGKAYKPEQYVHGASIHEECEPKEFIVKELETKGEYCASPVSHPHLYANAAEDGTFYLSTEKAGWKYYKLNN